MRAAPPPEDRAQRLEAIPTRRRRAPLSWRRLLQGRESRPAPQGPR